MKIGILGSGKVGSALGSWAAKVGHYVAFTSRDESKAREAAQKAGHGAKALDLRAMIDESEMILLTLPYGEIARTLEPFAEALRGKVVVDVTNPITPDRRDLAIGHTTSGAEAIAKKFPAAKVLKAFNATFAEVYASQQPRIDGRAITIFYAGDDAAAKEKIRQLIADFGFDPLDAGPLRNSRYLEPLSLLNIHLGRVLGYGTSIGYSLLREKSESKT